MAERVLEIQHFLSSSGWGGSNLVPLAGDASARRYLRLKNSAGGKAVLMDAPRSREPEITAFVDIANFLGGLGFSPPRILAADPARGLILMEDFGDAIYARQIGADPSSETRLYTAAVDVLIALDGAETPDFLREFDVATMAKKTRPAFEWYKLPSGTTGSSQFGEFYAELETLVKHLVPSTRSVLLRDFHAENLIWLSDRKGLRQVGLLDFQDAMIGPPGYDLVSLLQDARRDVEPALAGRMIERFCIATGRDEEEFRAIYCTLGAQRSLRILGVFARLCIAHGKPQYVDLIPRVWRHLKTCLAHPELRRIARLLEHDLPEPTPEYLRKLKTQCPPHPTL